MRKTNAPKAYLFYILFDDNHTNPQFGYAAVEETALLTHQRLALDVTIPLNGFMYIYIANESNINAATAVYFDDFKIVHEKNVTSLLVTESTDYDPFGLMLEGTRYVDETRIANNYKCQGEYAEFDELVGWNRFAGRGNYDARLGRWHSPDPKLNLFSGMSTYNAMLNSPVNVVDPDGECPVCFAMMGGAVMGAVSSAVGYSATALAKDKWNLSSFGQSIAFGAISGAVAGGIGGAFAGSEFAQTIGYSILTNTSSMVAANVITGVGVTASTVAGGIAGGIVGSQIPGFSGIPGGGWANIVVEIRHNAIQGAITGGFSGAVAAAIDGGDSHLGFVNGARNGAIGGADSGALKCCYYGPRIYSFQDIWQFSVRTSL